MPEHQYQGNATSSLDMLPGKTQPAADIFFGFSNGYGFEKRIPLKICSLSCFVQLESVLLTFCVFFIIPEYFVH